MLCSKIDIKRIDAVGASLARLDVVTAALERADVIGAVLARVCTAGSNAYLRVAPKLLVWTTAAYTQKITVESNTNWTIN